MGIFDFFRKKKMRVIVAGLLLLFCIIIGLEIWMNEKKSVEQSPEIQAEQSFKQETELAAEGESKLQEQFKEEALITEAPLVIETPHPVLTEEYELIYEGINVFNVGGVEAYFKYKNKDADLYLRRLNKDAGEYIELSLWSEQREIWHTLDNDLIDRDEVKEGSRFWEKDSTHLTLGQKMCYYVVPVDGTVYLMRYIVETTADMVTMSYKVFGISTTNSPFIYYKGSEISLDAGTLSIYLVSDDTVDSAVSFPVEQMIAFADVVENYMMKGHLVISTLQGEVETGISQDRENPISPYLYDIFPWIPEMVIQHNINTEGICSTNQMLTILQRRLPIENSVNMPDVENGEKYFITGDYYSDENYLTVRMKEDGSYVGHFLIENALSEDFVGRYDDGILTAVQISNYSDTSPYEMEISFKNGKAIVTITAVPEYAYVDVGEFFILDRNVKPKEFEYLKGAEDYQEHE